MSKHTAGPWAVVHTGEGLLIKSEATPGYFARIQGACAAAHGKQAEANARLIAAAPELLEACVEALRSFQTIGRGGVTTDILRAAIAKAVQGEE